MSELKIPSFQDKCAIVVGAGGGGHGTQIALSLARQGAKVFAVDVSEQALDDLRNIAQRSSLQLNYLQADATNSADISARFESIVDEHGGIDMLTNVVGGTRAHQWARLDQVSDDVFDEVLALNLRTVFITCREAAKRMIAGGRGGSIVNLSSVSGLAAAPAHGPYGAAKSAINALSQTMAIEFAEFHIRVNVIAPGSMSVERLRYIHRETEDVARGSIPLGHRGTPEDVAGTTLFLHSDLANYITGQIIAVDGGLMAKTPFESNVVTTMGPKKQQER